MFENLFEFIIVIIVGIVLIVLGILNINGNVSMVHSYHRKRVAPENILPFGRIVGTGSIIIGGGIILGAIFEAVNFYANIQFFSILSIVVMIAALVVGLVFFIVGTVKYNKGLF